MTTLGYQNVEELGTPEVSNLNTKSFLLPLQKSALFIADSGNWLDSKLGLPEDKDQDRLDRVQHLRDAVELSEYQLNNPNLSTGQNITTSLSSFAGMIVDPVSLLAGGVFGKVAAPATEYLISKAPSIISALSGGRIGKALINDYLNEDLVSFGTNRWANFLPTNLKEVIKSPIMGGALLTGFTLPHTFEESYNPTTNELDTDKFIKAIAFNGGLGFALPPIGWLAAHLHGKIFKFEPVVTDPAKARLFAKRALKNGDITQDEFNWYEKYIKDPNEKDTLLKEGVPLLKKDAHPLNLMTGRMEIPFITQEEFSKANTFILDRLGADESSAYYNAAVDYMAMEILDRNIAFLKENPTFLNAMKGQLEEVASILERKSSALSKLDNYLGRVLPEVKGTKAILTQKDLFSMMKRGKLAASEVPFNIPRNIEKLVRQENIVKESKAKISSLKKSMKKNPTPKYINNLRKAEERLQREEAKLKDLHHGENKLLSADEEIEKLEKKFLSTEELPNRYNTKRDYYRLHDLANVNPKAAKLLARIDAKAQYEMQEAYYNVLKGVSEVAESALEQNTNPESLINYLRDRLEKSSGFSTPSVYSQATQELEAAAEKIAEAKKVTPEQIEENYKRINENENLSSKAKEEFNEVYQRVKQFKGSEKILKELTDCVLRSGADVGL